MTADHGGRKLTSTNTGRAGVEPCSRCGKRKRADKLEPTRIGLCCKHCSKVIAAAESRAADLRERG